MEHALGLFDKCYFSPLLARATGDFPWHYTLPSMWELSYDYSRQEFLTLMLVLTQPMRTYQGFLIFLVLLLESEGFSFPALLYTSCNWVCTEQSSKRKQPVRLLSPPPYPTIIPLPTQESGFVTETYVGQENQKSFIEWGTLPRPLTIFCLRGILPVHIRLSFGLHWSLS